MQENTVAFENNRRRNWDLITDVLVIGSGFSGLRAAIEACNNGASVIILEKMKSVGGNSIISDGGIAAPASDDLAEGMYADMLKSGLGINHPELVRTVVEGAKDAFEWSRDVLGVKYLPRVDQFGGHSIARCYTPEDISGASLIKKMMEKVHELGIEVKFQMNFESFVQDLDGKVCGVIVRENYDYKKPTQGSQLCIKVNKGVILASGGYSSDVGFRMLQDPRLTENIDTTNKPFATAEGLKEALRIGAAPVHLSHIQLGPWACPDEKGYGVGPEFSEYIVFQYGCLIDPETGCRFVNELADRKSLSDQMLTIGHPCIGIADAQAVKASGWSIDRCLKKGIVKAFNDISALAAFYAMPIDMLEATLEKFNHALVEGTDQEFNKPFIEKAKQIMYPPFYAIRLWPKVHYTMGGIGINKKGEVINQYGDSIKGLYAAGEVTGGIHGASRLGSCSITECLVFGRIAGENAAKIHWEC